MMIILVIMNLSVDLMLDDFVLVWFHYFVRNGCCGVSRDGVS
jgi:hypothetical protein